MSRSKRHNCPRVKALDAKVERLERRVSELTAALEESRRAAKRQAAPFSKGGPGRHPKRPGRKPGRDYGKRAFRPTPRRVDEDYDVPLTRSSESGTCSRWAPTARWEGGCRFPPERSCMDAVSGAYERTGLVVTTDLSF